MNRFAAPLFLLTLPVTVAAQSGQKISVENFYLDNTHYRAIVRITNQDARPYRVIGIRCTFFRAGKAVDTSGNVAVNVGASETVFEKLIGPEKHQPVDSVQCRISYANP